MNHVADDTLPSRIGEPAQCVASHDVRNVRFWNPGGFDIHRPAGDSARHEIGHVELHMRGLQRQCRQTKNEWE